MMRIYETTNTRLQDYLLSKGFKPMIEHNRRAIYDSTKELRDALDSYYIRTYIFKEGF